MRQPEEQGKSPRIPRVDTQICGGQFSRVLGSPEVRDRFFEGELTLDGAITEIVMAEGKKPPVEDLGVLQSRGSG